jgi:hypothetical protein
MLALPAQVPKLGRQQMHKTNDRKMPRKPRVLQWHCTLPTEAVPALGQCLSEGTYNSGDKKSLLKDCSHLSYPRARCCRKDRSAGWLILVWQCPHTCGY